MESATAAARKELESRLVILATIGNNAPFVGLLGTVIGVVLAFEALGSGAAGAAQGAAPTAVMAAIAEALVATAVGIAVALPTVAAHNHVQRRITALLDDAETIARLVHAYLVARPATGEEA
jgi:biopolymer transport protein ExbB